MCTYLNDVNPVYISTGVTNDNSDISYNLFDNHSFKESPGIWGAIRSDDQTEPHAFHHNII